MGSDLVYVVISLQTPVVNQAVPSTCTFHDFPRLPRELQHMLYDYNMPGPRLIEFMREQRYDANKSKAERDITTPVLLHVNKDSRAYAQKRYTRCFYHFTRNHYPIWMDYQVDTLVVREVEHFIGFSEWRNFAPCRYYLEEVCNIAIGARPFKKLGFLVAFRGLRNVTFLKGSLPWAGESDEQRRVAALKADWKKEGEETKNTRGWPNTGELEIVQLTFDEFKENMRWDGKFSM